MFGFFFVFCLFVFFLFCFLFSFCFFLFSFLCITHTLKFLLDFWWALINYLNNTGTSYNCRYETYDAPYTGTCSSDTLWHTRSITDAYRYFLIYQIRKWRKKHPSYTSGDLNPGPLACGLSALPTELPGLAGHTRLNHAFIVVSWSRYTAQTHLSRTTRVQDQLLMLTRLV